MATITIALTFDEDKINSIANDLGYYFQREDGISDKRFIKSVMLLQLREARKQGRKVKQSASLADLDADILIPEEVND